MFANNTSEESEKNFNKLAEIMLKKALEEENINITVLIGAGISSSVGIPSGIKLRNELYNFWAECKEDIDKFLYCNFRDSLPNNVSLNTFDLTETNYPDITFEMLCSAITSGLNIEKTRLVEIFFKEKLEKDKNGDEFRIPIGYEVLAHFASYKLIDDTISLNFDELFELAVKDEMGKEGYQLVINDNDFDDILMGKEKYPLIIKPHGCLSDNKSMQFDVSDVIAFNPNKERILENKISNSYLIIIGCSCTSPDIQKLILKVCERNYNYEIFWIRREGDPEGNIKYYAKENLKNIIISRSQRNLCEVIYKLANNINTIAFEKRNIPYFLKLARHDVRINLFSKYQVVKYNLASKFLVELIIFALKVRREFFIEELLKCERIGHYINELEKDPKNQNIKPRDLINELVQVNILKSKWKPGGQVFYLEPALREMLSKDISKFSGAERISCGQDLIEILRQVKRFSINDVNDLEVLKNIYESFNNLKKGFDFDLVPERFKKWINMSFKEGRIFNSMAVANKKMVDLLKKANKIQCLANDGAWIEKFEASFKDKRDIDFDLLTFDEYKSGLEEIVPNINVNRIPEKIISSSNRRLRFTLIYNEDSDFPKVAIYTVRSGIIGCIFWSENRDDLKGVKDLFDDIMKRL